MKNLFFAFGVSMLLYSCSEGEDTKTMEDVNIEDNVVDDAANFENQVDEETMLNEMDSTSDAH